MSPTYRHTNHQVEAYIPDDLTMVTYPDGLAQVLTNLLMNSFAHGFTDDQEGHIEISCHEEGDQVILDYIDNGKGIDASIEDKIFDPFFTTRRDKNNTGLGMHIVYNIVNQQLKGQIHLLRDKDQGVHFRLDLPKDI